VGVIIDANNLEDWFEYAENIRRSEQHRRFEIDLHDGCWHLVSEQVVEDNALVVISTDITDKKKAEILLADMSKELFVLASTDALTNTSNRRHFIEQANAERRRCQREESGYALLMLDLDYFKDINDTYGHASGDNVLIRVTQTLKSQIREYDILGRVGGEEFAILLPNITREPALEIAERIRSCVESLKFTGDCSTLKATISIGIALDEKSEKSLDDMFLVADKLLYRAKEGGRNLVAIEKK
jgi:diguanylate cyclase (GGDEF)-like protein